MALSLALAASACGGGGNAGNSTTTTSAIDVASTTDLGTVPDTVASTDLDTVPDTGLDTGTTGAGGEDEYAASPEFCAAWKNIQPSGLFIGSEGIEGLIIQFREQLTEALGLAPEELKPSIQKVLDIEIDPNDPLASSPMFRPIVAEIELFVAENCAPIPQPTFMFDRLEQSGGGWVVFVTGVCPDGSFPVDVTGPSEPFSEVRFTAVDLGSGSYSLGTYDVPIDPAGYTEEQFLDEFGILDGMNGSCT